MGALVILLCACTPVAGSRSSESGSPVVAASASASPSSSASMDLPLVQLADDPEPPAGDVDVLLGLTPEGSRIIVRMQRPTSLTLTRPTVMLRRNGVDTVLWRQQSEPFQQVTSASSRGNVVAWRATTSTSLEASDWYIYVSRNGEPGRLIASSRELVKGPLMPDPPEARPLAVTDTEVVWGVARRVGDRFAADLWSAPIDGSRPGRIFQRGVHLPVVEPDGSLLYVRSNQTDPEASTEHDEIWRHSVRGTDELVRTIAGAPIYNLCASRRFMAWSATNRQDPSRGDVTVVDRGSGLADSFTLPSNPPFYAGCLDGAVAIGQNTGTDDSSEWLYLAPGRPLYKLANAPGYGWVEANGTYLAWTLPSTTTAHLAYARLHD